MTEKYQFPDWQNLEPRLTTYDKKERTLHYCLSRWNVPCDWLMHNPNRLLYQTKLWSVQAWPGMIGISGQYYCHCLAGPRPLKLFRWITKHILTNIEMEVFVKSNFFQISNFHISQTSRKWLTVAIFQKWQDSSLALWIKIAVILNWR